MSVTHGGSAFPTDPENDLRNVADQYKGWVDELIVTDLDQKYTGADALVVNLEKDFNFACVVRCANNFGLRSVYFIGPKRWDRRGAVGCYHYTEVIHVGNTIADGVNFFVNDWRRPVVMVENSKDIPPERIETIGTFNWPEKPLIVLGSESLGIDPELYPMADAFVSIPGYGSVRSLNVATAAGIAFYDYTAKLQP